MPNQRDINQAQVAFALDIMLLVALDDARKAEGKDRSTFIRIAIIEKLHRMGIKISMSLAFAPDRAADLALNDKPNSAKTIAAHHMAKKVDYRIPRKKPSV
jgi:hypothetical protein